METLKATETLYRGFTAGELSDLSDIDVETLRVKMSNPRTFTITEVSNLAPHLGLTADTMVARILDWA